MKHFPYIALLVLILAALACSAPGAAPEPTATPVPSNTSAPTNTPLPTDTATPPPTATPDKTATAVAQATQSASDVLDELDKLLGDSDVPYKDGHLAWQQENSINVQLSGPSHKMVQLNKDLSVKNFIFKSDVTWEATGWLVCGAAFRSEPNVEEGKQYLFSYLRLSGLPAWAIEVYEFGEWKNSPSGVKTSDAVDLRNGATNQFALVVQDDHFTVYINQVRQGTYYDYSQQRTEGYFGLLADQDSGRGSCEFQNTWVWSLD